MSRVGADRKAYTRSNSGLRRARLHFTGLLRGWCDQAKDPEAYRERVRAVAKAAKERGLYAAGATMSDLVHSVMSLFGRRDGLNCYQYMSLGGHRCIALLGPHAFRRWKFTVLRRRTA